MSGPDTLYVVLDRNDRAAAVRHDERAADNARRGADDFRPHVAPHLVVEYASRASVDQRDDDMTHDLCWTLREYGEAQTIANAALDAGLAFASALAEAEATARLAIDALVEFGADDGHATPRDARDAVRDLGDRATIGGWLTELHTKLAEAEALAVRLANELRTYTRVDRRLDGVCCKRCDHRVPDHEPDCEIGHLLTEAYRDR